LGYNACIWELVLIDKLYNLKQLQIDQKISEKGQVVSKLNSLEEEIEKTIGLINTTSVNRYGAISDFSILEMHKQTMKEHVRKLQIQKQNANQELDFIEKEIIELQKESEQFKYILEEQKKEKMKEILKNEQLEVEELIQSKYIAQQGE